MADYQCRRAGRSDLVVGAGIAFASILQNITGIGSIFILSVLILITLLLFVERDLQKNYRQFKAVDGANAGKNGAKPPRARRT